MSLDFSALDNIPHGSIKPSPDPITAPAVKKLERVQRNDIKQIYATYQQNITRAGTLRSDILKGIRLGEDPLALLLKALECISLMTGDKTLYTQSKGDILAIYGWGLEEPAPLELELGEVRKRLAMLTRPELTASTSPDATIRLIKAVNAHMELEEKLEQKGGKNTHQNALEASKKH